jgi:FkbM family methyltransferase
MRAIIKSLVRRFGYQIQRVSSETVDEPWLDNPFVVQKALLTRLGIDGPTIFDIGAHHGNTVASYRSMLPNSTIYCFEPFPESFAILKARFQYDQKIIPLALAVADKSGRRDFFVNHWDFTNSLLKPPSAGRQYYPKANVLKEVIQVPTISLDHFMGERSIESCDLLKIDIQGGELLALEGGQKLLREQRPFLIYLEVPFVPHYEGQALFHELCAFLNGFGYTPFNLYDLQISDNGQLTYADALFVSERMRTEVIDAIRNVKVETTIAWRLFVHGAQRSPFVENARVLARFNHVARFIVKANHSIM